MENTRENLLLFFDRPSEPIFMEKGDSKTRFNMPEKYYPEEYKNLYPSPMPALANMATMHSAAQESMFRTLQLPDEIPSIPIHDMNTVDIEDVLLPDLTLPMELRRDEQFSFFLPKHRQMAGILIDVFMSMSNLQELQSVFAYCQPRINPYMFNYCVSVAILHRPDTRGIDIPTFAETFPAKFVDRKSLRRAREYCSVIPEGTTLPLVEIKLPVNPKAPEQRLAYFREDVGLNSHHWHWHLIYPIAAKDGIVNKDRRGELFYYMHHQVMARYNTERMCNGLERTKPYVNFREPIAEGYFPTLDSANSSHAYSPRFDNIVIHDVNRPGNTIKISDMEKYRENILDAIKQQAVLLRDGNRLQLDEETGIDILGNLVEATSISINPDHYGDYHNKGHLLIAYVHDPEERHEQAHSVMGDSATAMRDPVFYRWHACIDNLFTLYKDKLTPYSPDKLDFPDISVSSIKIEGVGGLNIIKTLWERSVMSLNNGLDFAPRRNVFAQFTHLQHEEFDFVIDINNTSCECQMGTIRIFMAPTEDENGQALSFNEQRNLMIEMDKFSQSLSPGNNKIRRSNMDSSVTIPFERIFRENNAKSGPAASSGFNFCDCGWPQYLLVPKGTTEGYPMVLFVMVSNWKEDKVERDLTGTDNDNASYCGLRDQKYPDRRAMGFPFDRKPAPGIDSLDKFLQPNMAFNKCIIKFTGRTRNRGQDRVDQPEEEKPHVGKGDATESTPGHCQRPGNTGPSRCDRTGLGGGRCDNSGHGGDRCGPNEHGGDRYGHTGHDGNRHGHTGHDGNRHGHTGHDGNRHDHTGHGGDRCGHTGHDGNRCHTEHDGSRGDTRHGCSRRGPHSEDAGPHHHGFHDNHHHHHQRHHH